MQLLEILAIVCSAAVVTRAGGEKRTMPAPCAPGFFPCNDSLTCVEQRFNCDGIVDCPEDGSDERDCEDYHKRKYYNELFRKRPDEDRDEKIALKRKCFLADAPEECICSSFGVYCVNRGLDQVPAHFPRNTQELDLSSNRLEELRPSNFSSLPNLYKLILTDTAIRDIASHTFEKMLDLRRLFLTRNRLSSIHRDTFVTNRKLTLLVLSHNPITRLETDCFRGLSGLLELDLRHCQISTIEANLFEPLSNLEKLWLDGNQLQEISPHSFVALENLETLSITNNSIDSIYCGSFRGLYKLSSLSLSVNNLTRLKNNSFQSLDSLLKLDLRSNRISYFEEKAFHLLPSIESLDLSRNPFRKLPPNLFDEVQNLTHIYFDEFRFCSNAIHVRLCFPRGDGISSSYHLLDNVVLRSAVWVVAFLACLGNVCVLIGRMLMQELNEVHSFFIKNLAVADLLMGLYLLIIAFYDLKYRGEYIKYEETWRHSWECNFCGFLSTLSSEASVFTLTVITIDRYLSVRYPLSLTKRTMTFARMCMFSVWSLAIGFAALPIFAQNSFGDEFYGNNGVCLPLQIHDPYSTAWEYSTFLFCIVNSAAFMFIAYAYVIMSFTITSSRSGLRTSQQQQDRSIAKRFGFIVATDCLCWMPIVVIKILALTGVPINDDLYAWVAVFLLPVNSALNPILYTLTTKLFKQHLAKIMSHSRRHGSPGGFHDHSEPSIGLHKAFRYSINSSGGSDSPKRLFDRFKDRGRKPRTVSLKSGNGTLPSSLRSISGSPNGQQGLNFGLIVPSCPATGEMAGQDFV